MSTICVSQSIPSDSYLVYLYYPGKWVVKAQISSNIQIRELKKVLPIKTVNLLFSGNILQDSFTFSYYGIVENDAITVVQNNCDISKFVPISRNRQQINEKIRSIIDPSLYLEMARIKDVQNTRIEKKTRTFRKICSLFSENSILDRQSSKESHLSYEKPSLPSTCPLPCSWNHDSSIESEKSLFSSFPSVVAVNPGEISVVEQ